MKADRSMCRGSLFLARFHYYYPERFTKYAFLDVAYAAPRVPFSVDAVNEFSQKLVGYPIFGYWHFFNDPKAGEMMDEKVLLSSCIVWNSWLIILPSLTA